MIKSQYPRPKWDQIYARHFPEHTCAMSRHAVLVAETVRDKKGQIYRIIEAYDEPERVAQSIEGTIIELWAVRKFLDSIGYDRITQANGPSKWVKRDSPPRKETE